MPGAGRAIVVAEVAQKKNKLRHLYVELRGYFAYNWDRWPLVERSLIALSNYYDGEDLKSKQDISRYMLGYDIPADREYCMFGEPFTYGALVASNNLKDALDERDKENENKTNEVHKGIYADMFIQLAECGVLLAEESLEFETTSIERATYGGI